MNTLGIKDIVGKKTIIKFAICAVLTYLVNKNNTAKSFDAVITGLYLYSVITVLQMLYRKSKSIIACIFLPILTVIILIKVPLPGMLVTAFSFIFMFFGAVYDCYYLLLSSTIAIDKKRGNSSKWDMLHNEYRRSKGYTADETIAMSIMSDMKDNKEKAKRYAQECKQMIHEINTIKKKIESAGKFSYDVSKLDDDYDDLIRPNWDFIRRLAVDDSMMIMSTQAEECCKNISDIYNKLARIRDKFISYEKSMFGNSAGNTNLKSTEESVFFKGCTSLEGLQKRYKTLCKEYHPDTNSGSSEAFRQVQEEYECLKKTF